MTFFIRPLSPAEAEQLEIFLRPHTAEAYFLRSNALTAGLAYNGHFLEAEYLGAFSKDSLVGVAAYSWLNTLLIYADDPACLPEFADALRPFIQKRAGKVEAIIGLKTQADTLIHALQIPPEAFRERGDDGLYRLLVEQMIEPSLPPNAIIRQAENKDREQLISWRVAFNIEALHAAPGPKLEEKVREEIENRLMARELFVLEKAGMLLSFCNLAGQVPEAVMVGSVWTPPELRCRGYARFVTGGAIKELSRQRPRLREVILFASSPHAIRAYEALGFKRIGDWRLALIKENHTVS